MSAYGSSSAASSGSRTNGLAIAGLACGVVGIFIFSIVLGPLAIIFGAVALRQKAVKGSGGMAKAAIILGIVDVILAIVLMAVAASSGGFSWYIGG
ncbi:hypothetical protein GCM10010277_61280 [Streptomyces longisporoflavus]|uniref:DUF4190 domain-containing protein n=1 Tax=Streptomyces longisporoflavus TaxID=28044 RepID=UPI00167CF5E0|nr:DUF4190 domain-containing protein [Streptomyces longisporoflavus]GGV58500.1 hypothetical protein GCM10010277_61280 [Streptomyces longisporoflavus]